MAKFTGKSAEFWVKSSGGTPAYVPVAQVQEISGVSVTAEEVDVTTLDAGDYRDYLQGFKDPGECELTVIFDPELAAHDASAGTGRRCSRPETCATARSSGIHRRQWAAIPGARSRPSSAI